MKTDPVIPHGEERDDASRRRTEDLQRVNEVLTERDDLLRAQAEELARSNADLRQFACLAWHDLQEPLRAIGIYAQLLKHRYHSRIDEDADRMIGSIADGVQRMETLIRGLLAYSRAGSAEEEAKPEAAQAGDALEAAMANLVLMIEESGTVVESDPLPTVPWSADQLTQIFQNLLSNAIKYRGPEPLRVHVTAKGANGEWVLSVSDNGVGIAPDHHEAIFRPFKRLHGAQYPGAGIGLALCRRIVERNGGRIWVESEPGQGAAFRFSIPVNKGRGAPTGLPKPMRSSPSPSSRHVV